MDEGWQFDHRRGPATSLVASWPQTDRWPGRRRLAQVEVDSPAYILGSTQRDGVVEDLGLLREGHDVVRRRTGGGLVWVRPGDPLWIDLWVPRNDTLFSADVATSFHWLGEVWRDALTGLGLGRPEMIRQRNEVPDSGVGEWCFGSVGPGEVVVANGRKVVGLAQRRTRHGAWFTSAAYRWQPWPSPVGAATGGTDGASRTALGPDQAVGWEELAAIRGGPAVESRDVLEAFGEHLELRTVSL